MITLVLSLFFPFFFFLVWSRSYTAITEYSNYRIWSLVSQFGAEPREDRVRTGESVAFTLCPCLLASVLYSFILRLAVYDTICPGELARCMADGEREPTSQYGWGVVGGAFSANRTMWASELAKYKRSRMGVSRLGIKINFSMDCRGVYLPPGSRRSEEVV